MIVAREHALVQHELKISVNKKRGLIVRTNSFSVRYLQIYSVK